jgi:hypothetical protein
MVGMRNGFRMVAAIFFFKHDFTSAEGGKRVTRNNRKKEKYRAYSARLSATNSNDFWSASSAFGKSFCLRE